MAQASSHTPGQQDATFPLVMEHEGQQRHHQDKNNSAADDSVGDAGVVAQAVVQRDKVLPRSFCRDGKQREDGSKVKQSWRRLREGWRREAERWTVAQRGADADIPSEQRTDEKNKWSPVKHTEFHVQRPHTWS